MEQLSLIQAEELLYVFLDAFYSTGKSEILKFIAKLWIKKKKVVHYFVHRLDYDASKENPPRLPFTIMLENEFRNFDVQIKETTHKFGTDSVWKFFMENGIKQGFFVCQK